MDNFSQGYERDKKKERKMEKREQEEKQRLAGEESKKSESKARSSNFMGGLANSERGYASTGTTGGRKTKLSGIV